MKKNLRKFILIAIASTSVVVTNAQQVSTFENLTLAPSSYWDGSKTVLKNDTAFFDTTFVSGDAIFPNRYSRLYPKYPTWAKGWAYSNVNDAITPGKTYNVYTGSGYNSDNYAIGQDSSVIRLNGNAKGAKVNGLYITNSTYAGLSMKNGDGFAKKFGDTTGTNSGLPQGSYPDWFKLTIKGYSNGALKVDSVDFYLADFRFADNSKDYIVNTWEWVDLTSLGNVDSVIFKLSSSDTGLWGMNTPAFFCIDNFTTQSPVTSVAAMNIGSLKLYPNPANENLIIDLAALNPNEISTLDVLDLSGKRIETININNSMLINIPVSDYAPGVYFISVKNANTVINAKFIKN